MRITTTEQYIDSRDLIETAEEIEAMDDDDRDDDDREMLAAIEAIADCCEDWIYGKMLIREDCFQDYARELAEDIGAINPGASWPLSYIDWEAAANALASDYTTVEFLGATYYVR